jgi:hypothetical protein
MKGYIFVIKVKKAFAMLMNALITLNVPLITMNWASAGVLLHLDRVVEPQCAATMRLSIGSPWFLVLPHKRRSRVEDLGSKF